MIKGKQGYHDETKHCNRLVKNNCRSFYICLRRASDDICEYRTGTVGFVFMALGMAVYMKSEQCCGPRDSLLVGLGKRMQNVPIGIVEIILWGMVLFAGWGLGGPVGIGTIISTFGAGLVMQIVYSLIRFEPRQLNHKSVTEVTRVLIRQS